MKKKITKQKTKTKPKPEGYVFGRPPKYDPKTILPKVRKYIDSCEDTFYEVINRPGSRDKNTKFYIPTVQTKRKVNLPTLEGLAQELDITRETIYAWRKKFPDFSYIIGKLLQKQAKMLLEAGLSGDYNSVIAKLMLTKHGYKDSMEVTTMIDEDLLSDKEKKKLDEILDRKVKSK